MGYLVLSTVNISYIEMKVKMLYNLLVSIFIVGHQSNQNQINTGLSSTDVMKLKEWHDLYTKVN